VCSRGSVQQRECVAEGSNVQPRGSVQQRECVAEGGQRECAAEGVCSRGIECAA